MFNNIEPYKINVVFNKKQFEVHILLKRIIDNKVQCDYEIFTEERISGDEFQKLKKYLNEEGYVDAAFTHYNIITSH